jgi:general secretion pathway protein G
MTLKKRIKRGFTLVEILIVVVILGILAAIVIPQFSNASEEASYNRVRADLQTVRSQIQFYKIQHLGTLPDAANFEAHMTGYTLATTGPSDDNSAILATTTGALGPYLQQMPTNPLVSPDGDVIGTGWTYDATTGAFNAAKGVATEDITLW